MIMLSIVWKKATKLVNKYLRNIDIENRNK